MEPRIAPNIMTAKEISEKSEILLAVQDGHVRVYKNMKTFEEESEFVEFLSEKEVPYRLLYLVDVLSKILTLDVYGNTSPKLFKDVFYKELTNVILRTIRTFHHLEEEHNVKIS